MSNRLSSTQVIVPRKYREMLDTMLAETGYYTFDDIMEHIRDGYMQSFATDRTWAVTQINEFPRKKVLDLVFVVGDYDDLENLESQIIKFAVDIGADHITTAGRRGFERKHLPGWTQTTTNFVRHI